MSQGGGIQSCTCQGATGETRFTSPELTGGVHLVVVGGAGHVAVGGWLHGSAGLHLGDHSKRMASLPGTPPAPRSRLRRGGTGARRTRRAGIGEALVTWYPEAHFTPHAELNTFLHSPRTKCPFIGGNNLGQSIGRHSPLRREKPSRQRHWCLDRSTLPPWSSTWSSCLAARPGYPQDRAGRSGGRPARPRA